MKNLVALVPNALPELLDHGSTHVFHDKALTDDIESVHDALDKRKELLASLLNHGSSSDSGFLIILA
jgi:hypothetical protein